MLRLRTFGGLALDQPTVVAGPVVRRRPLALLALLAVAGERGSSREKVAAYLWPESDDEHARNSLSQALSSLRRELGTDDVVLGSVELRLNPDALTSDVQDFARFVDQGRLAEAVAVYAGPFLDGVFLKGAPELERWVEQERQRLQQTYATALEQLAAAATAEGDTASAVRWWRTRAQLTPLDATPALGLMRALAAAGDSPSALQYFRVHQALLRAELDADPAPEVVTLADRLRSSTARSSRAEAAPHPVEAAVEPAAMTPLPPWHEQPVKRRFRHFRASLALAGAVVSAFTILSFNGGAKPNPTGAAAPATSIGAPSPVSDPAASNPAASKVPAAAPAVRIGESPDRLGASRVVVGTLTRVVSSADSLYFDASISPDGNHVAYAAGAAGQMRIVVRSLAGSMTILASDGVTGNHRWPRWSPDGSRIVFQVASPGAPAGQLYQVPAFGGTPEVLVERGAWPAWSRDGRLAYVDNGVWVLPANGERAVHIDSTPNAGWPSWSPDGRRLVFASDDQHFLGSSYGGAAKNAVWVIDADGRHKRRLYAADALHAVPVWSPNGRAILFVSSRDGILDVYRQDIGPDSLVGLLERVTVGANAYTFSLSADGSRMAYNSLRFDAGSNIWTAPIGESLMPFSSARPVTRGNQQIESFSISHDGRWLAFDSDRDADGYLHIYKVALNGRSVVGNPIRLTHQQADDYDPRWSPDDSEIAFHRKIRDNRDVYVMGADGRHEVRVTIDTARQDYHPDWSPDGKSLVYTSRGDNGYDVFTVTRDASGRWSESRLVSQPKRGSNVARWSPVGDDVALWPGALRLLSLKDGETRQLLTREQLGENITAVSWGSNASELYMQTRDSNRVISFWRFDSLSRTPTRVLKLTDSVLKSRQPYFDVHGRNLFFTISPAGSEVYVAALSWRR